MRLTTTLFLLLFVLTKIFTQSDTLYKYDFLTGEFSTIEFIVPDILPEKASSNHYTGGGDLDIAVLSDFAPTDNLIPDTEITVREIASNLFDLESYPLSASVRINSNVEDAFDCSGNMISSRHVLSSVHCVFDPPFFNEIFSDSVFVEPAYDQGVSSRFGRSRVIAAYAFMSARSFSGHDYVILELEEDLGLETGWLGIGYDTDEALLEDQLYHRFVYPISSMFTTDTTEFSGEEMYYSYGVYDILNDIDIAADNMLSRFGEGGGSVIKVKDNQYLSFGVNSWFTDNRHSRFTDNDFYIINELIGQDNSVSTFEPLEEPLTVYPNPTLDFVTITIPKDKQVSQCSLYNDLGMLVKKESLYLKEGDNLTIDLTDFSTGVYTVRIRFDKYESIVKVVKQSQ